MGASVLEDHGLADRLSGAQRNDDGLEHGLARPSLRIRIARFLSDMDEAIVVLDELHRTCARGFLKGGPELDEERHGAAETATEVAALLVGGPVGCLAGDGAVEDFDVADVCDLAAAAPHRAWVSAVRAVLAAEMGFIGEDRSSDGVRGMGFGA